MGLPLDLVLRSMGRSLRSLAAEAVELRDVGTRCLVPRCSIWKLFGTRFQTFELF
jgi:hypothetical protein